MFDEFYKVLADVSGTWEVFKTEDFDLSAKERIVGASVQSSGEEPVLVSFLLIDL